MVTDGGTPTGDGGDDSPAVDGDDGDPAADQNDSGSADRDEAATAPADTDGVAEPKTPEPTDEEIVAVASDAAEGLVFSRYRRSDVRDVDVTVGFEDGVLEVDVYLNVPDADVEEHVDDEAQQVADDAALAAIDAVDRLFEARGA